jgi:hypothetical protein
MLIEMCLNVYLRMIGNVVRSGAIPVVCLESPRKTTEQLNHYRQFQRPQGYEAGMIVI